MTVLDSTTLSRWKTSPISFVEEVLCDPETGKPFGCCPRDRVHAHAFALDDDGRLLYPELATARRRKRQDDARGHIVIVMVLLRNEAASVKRIASPTTSNRRRAAPSR